MKDLTEDQLKKILELNNPLLDRGVKQEQTYSTSIFFVCSFFFLLSIIFGNIFSSFCIFLAIAFNFVQSRISSYAIDRQMAINIKTITSPIAVEEIEENTWIKIIGVLHWMNFGFFCLGVLVFLLLKK